MLHQLGMHSHSAVPQLAEANVRLLLLKRGSKSCFLISVVGSGTSVSSADSAGTTLFFMVDFQPD